jgi:hypothetical protein
MIDMRKKKRKVDKRKEKVVYKGMIFCEASFIVILGAFSCCFFV